VILVFGKDGQVGRELQRFKNVTAFGREQADFRNPEQCVSLIHKHKPNAVVNAVAYTNVDQAEIDEELATKINCDTPREIARACSTLGIPYVHISTDYVFDGTGNVASRPNDLPNPQNAYGRTKRCGEVAVKDSGAIFVILRTSWIISAHGTNFVKTMLKLSKSRDSIDVVADQVGGPTPAMDVAAACIEIAKQLCEKPTKIGVYHFSGFPDVSWFSFASSIFELSGRKTIVSPIKTSDYPTLAKRPLNSRLDCSLTTSTFGVTRPSWRSGISEIISDLESCNEET